MPKTVLKQDIKQKYNTDILNLAFDTLNKDKQALFFLNTKRSAEKCAEEISLKNKTQQQAWHDLANSILTALPKPTKQCERLSRCVKKGVAFHHAGLTSKQRETIEDGFRDGKLKIICSTPTLAAGLDLPAYRVIIKDLRRFGGKSFGGLSYIPVLEYLQMAGRAGRPKFDKMGEAIITASDDKHKEKLYDRYILGEPEEILSKLAVEPVLRTYILSLLATEFVSNRSELIEFFNKTFWAHQFKDMQKLEKIINKMLRLLEEWDFIKTGRRKSDFVTAADIADDKLEATLLGKRVAELYIDPLTANQIIVGLDRSDGVYITSFALLQLVCNTLEMIPQLRVKNKEMDKIHKRYMKFESGMLDLEPSAYEPEYDYYLNSLKTAFFMEDWISELDEEYLLEEYDIRPGETRMKIERADWLLFASAELAKIQKKQKVLKEILKLRFRLKYGVKEELLALLKLQNIGRVRARRMYNLGIHDIGAVKKADITTLAQLLGRKLALDVKRQVGQDFSKVKIPERRRKGQISLNDY